jgi:hypothetical protein
MRMIITSAGVALILALAGTLLAIVVFSRRGYAERPGRRAPPPCAGSAVARRLWAAPAHQANLTKMSCQRSGSAVV